MPEKTQYTLLYDEPSSFLDERGNPRTGRRLCFQLTDGTRIEIQVSTQEYKQPKEVLTKLQEYISAHNALLGS